MKIFTRFLMVMAICIFLAKISFSLPAFPGAEGFGAVTRGAYTTTNSPVILQVTNTNDSGTGSLRAALVDTRPRVIIFKTGGIINLQSYVYANSPYMTIMGQTAPGNGVCVKGYPVKLGSHDVIVRGMRFRNGYMRTSANDRRGNCISAEVNGGSVGNLTNQSYNIIFDHNSISWGGDEMTGSWFPANHITWQWNIVSESLYVAGFESITGYGHLVGDDATSISVHHNLYAHNKSRNPEVNDGTSGEIINNVIYHYTNKGIDFIGNPTEFSPFLTSNWNVTRNYFKRNSSGNYPILIFIGQGYNNQYYVKSGSKFYAKGNYDYDNPSRTGDWDLVQFYDDGQTNTESDYKLSIPATTSSGIIEHDAGDTYNFVLNNAGARAPAIDPVDSRIVNDVINNTGNIKTTCSDSDYPSYPAGAYPTDSDNDGLPDSFEQQNGGSSTGLSANGTAPSGYSWIEEYSNSLLSSYFPTAGPADTTLPATINTLTASIATATSITLSWTAVGDDGTTGTASSYDIRYMANTPVTTSNWSSALQCSNEPTPKASGNSETFMLTNLTPNTNYYFAIKVGDEVYNWSEVSNSPLGKTLTNITLGEMVSEWHFDEGSGLTANDTSTKNNDGTLMKGTVWVSGKVGTGALRFDGVDDYVTVPNSTSLNIRNAISIEAWVKTDKTTSDSGITGKVIEKGKYCLGAGERALFQITVGGVVRSAFKTWSSSEIGVWHHLVGTYDSVAGPNNFVLYQDGVIVSQASVTGNIDTSTIALLIGRTSTNSKKGRFKGVIDEAKIYSRALTQQEVLEHFQGYVSVSDTILPLNIVDLSVTSVSTNSATLGWTATGDDGTTGTATVYDIRYMAETPITSSNFISATEVAGVPAPKISGQSETMMVNGLIADTTYYFAINVIDEVPNTSEISNTIMEKTQPLEPDTTAPAAVDTLSISTLSTDKITLTWISVGDDGTTGIASNYDLRYSTVEIEISNWDYATQCSELPVPKVAGSSETFTIIDLTADTSYYFALKVGDEIQNWSAISNVLMAKTANIDNSGLVGEWKFDEGSGTVAGDSSGSNNAGTLINSPEWVAGKVGNGLQFDGTNKYVSVNNSDNLNVNNQITLEALVKTNVITQDGGPTRRIIDKGMYILAASDKAYFKIYVGGAAKELGYTWSSSDIGVWHHIVGTYDSAGGVNNFRLYQDGLLVSQMTLTGNIDTNTAIINIGRQGSSTGRFNGIIDEVRIYNRALSSGEVASRYTRFLLSFGIFGAAANNLDDVHVYPNPFKPSLGHNNIIFSNLTNHTEIRIFNISGEMVFENEINTANGRLIWPVTNRNDNEVASGIYLYIINNDRNQTKK